MTSRPALLLILTGLSLATVATAAPLAHAQDKAPAAAVVSSDATAVTLFRAKAKQRVTLEKSDKELYSGVIPGKRDEVEHISKAVEKGKKEATPGQLTWIGFLPEKTRTRVFLQTPGVENYEATRSEDRKTLTITLPQTKISTRNVTRPVDTSAYKRKVTNIQAKRKRGKTVHVHLSVEASSEPQISRIGEFIYIDFSHVEPASAARAGIE